MNERPFTQLVSTEHFLLKLIAHLERLSDIDYDFIDSEERWVVLSSQYWHYHKFDTLAFVKEYFEDWNTVISWILPGRLG